MSKHGFDVNRGFQCGAAGFGALMAKQTATSQIHMY
jgi:hypothetical protein